MFDFALATRRASLTIDSCERVLGQAMRRMDARRRAYPDANATLRLSFGTVAGFRAADAVDYACYTTVRGVLEKARAPTPATPTSASSPPSAACSPGATTVPMPTPRAARCTSASSPPTTSPAATAAVPSSTPVASCSAWPSTATGKGWPATSCTTPPRQRTIGVDIRYVLFITDRYAHAPHLLRELEAAGGK